MRLMRSVTCLLTLALAVMGLTPSASASSMITYASTAQGDFGTLDLITGVYTSIGLSGIGDGNSIVGLGYYGGQLFGVDNNTAGTGTGSLIYSIDTSTGVATQTGALAFGATATGGTSGAGLLIQVTAPIGIFQGALLGGDPSGTTVALPLGFLTDGLVAFTPGNLYASGFTGDPINGDDLYSLVGGNLGGLNDGAGNGQAAITGLVVGGTLYTTDGDYVYTYGVTPTSVTSLLTATLITGTVNGDQIFALAPIVPEPSSVVMGAIAIGLAGLVQIRRSRLGD